MRRRRQARWTGRVAALAATVVLGGGLGSLAGPGAALAAACAPWSGAQPVDPPSTPENDTFAGVALVSSCEAWAVGDRNVGGQGAMIWHWTGGGNWTDWTAAHSFGLPGSNLFAVAAADQSHVWAVGNYADTATSTLRGLLARFDGSQWSAVALPPSINVLNAVTAVSATDAWAVGKDQQGAIVLLHYDGTSWTQVPAPALPSSQTPFPMGITATSASSAWVVGGISTPDGAIPMILHWDGTSWSQAPAPGDNTSQTVLNSVSATSPSNAWAVGFSISSATSTESPVTLHWDGQSWTAVPNPGPTSDSLNGVTAVSANSAWAVGGPDLRNTGGSLVLHWNGTAWSQVTSHDPSAGLNVLKAISPGPAGMVFAVGSSLHPASRPSDQSLGLAAVFGIVPIGALKDTPQQAADLMASAGLSSVVAAVTNSNPACNGLTNGLIVGSDPAATVPTAPPVILDQCNI